MYPAELANLAEVVCGPATVAEVVRHPARADSSGATMRVARYPIVRISVTAGPDVGSTLDVAGREVRVGTGIDNDLVVSDRTASPVHCALEPTNNGLRVRDEGSTNGIFCLGNRVFDAIIGSYPVSLLLAGTALMVRVLDLTVERRQLEVDSVGSLLGRSSQMRELFADLQPLCASDTDVLIEGEGGTGKKLAAKMIHQHSRRANAPFLVCDCTVEPGLAERKLWGHSLGVLEKGVQPSRPCLLEQAAGGTLLLDEVGALTLELQRKILQFIEKRELRGPGDSHPARVDVRLLATTKRNLSAQVDRGHFDQELYSQLARSRLRLPPLRARMQDLPLLVRHFISQDAQAVNPAAIPRSVWELLRSHRWPGNVRELKDAVQILTRAPQRVQENWVAQSNAKESPFQLLLPLRVARQQAIDAFEKDYLKFALERFQGNVTRAAAAIEISRQMCHRLLRKHASHSSPVR